MGIISISSLKLSPFYFFGFNLWLISSKTHPGVSSSPPQAAESEENDPAGSATNGKKEEPPYKKLGKEK